MKKYKMSGVLLIVTTLLFIIILLVHLFKEQTWTADTVKILVGVLVGAGSTKISWKRTEKNTVDNRGFIIGDVAGRDINKIIQNIENAILDIKDSVVHQNNKIEQIVDSNTDNDYVINRVFERESSESEQSEQKSYDKIPDRRFDSISRVIQYWHHKGWTLRHFSSDYQGMDGIFLIFEKPKRFDEIQIYNCRGSDTSKFENIP